MTTYGRTNAVTAGGGTPTPTQTKEVQATAFPTVVTPDSGYALSQATVTAPANLSAENIKAGVSIAGVEGSYQGSGEPVVDPVAEKFRALASATAENIDFTWSDIVAWMGTPVNNKTTWLIYGRTIKSVEINLNEAIPNFISGVVADTIYLRGQFNGLNTMSGRFTGHLSYDYTGVTHLGPLFNDSYFDDDIVVPEGITSMKGTFDGISKGITGVSSSITVTLPSTLSSISGRATVHGHYDKPINIIMKATTPPTLESAGSLSSEYSTNKYLHSITVPVGCLEAYQNATNWAFYADFMVEATE